MRYATLRPIEGGRQSEGAWARFLRTHAASIRFGLPFMGVGLLAMVLTDAAKWAQLLAAVAIFTFIGLNMRANLQASREMRERREREPTRREFIVGGIVGVLIGLVVFVVVAFVVSRFT